MIPTWRTRLALSALGRLPLNALSRGAGRVAALRLPGPLQRGLIRLFAAAVGVDWSEVRDPIDSFDSLQAFFTRALAKGVRPLDVREEAFLSPCDGAWGASGHVSEGTLLQVKGRPYRLADLLGSEEAATALEGGPFTTLYLSPRDYHRFHAPLDVQVSQASYLPGSLWPVNHLGVEGVPGLFGVNERICIGLQPRQHPGAQLMVVAVGATLVGGVRVVFDAELGSNRADGKRRERSYPDLPRIARGDELGRFEFGSTLVVVASPGWLALEAPEPGSPLRVGTRIGSVTLLRPAEGQPGGTP